MKKFISLAIMLLVSAVAVDASAQASKLVGKWSVDSSVFGLEKQGFKNAKSTMIFEEDGEVEVLLSADATMPIDDQTSVVISIEFEVEADWTLDGSVISLNATDVDVDIEKIAIEPYNPMYADVLVMLKDELEKQLRAEMSGLDENFSGEMTIVYIDDKTMKLNDAGDIVICKRIW
ncbi:MAG: hypothetical protein IKV04_06750 [Alistipes sp.]|nr:hypothetical protein [Alistipes sp.]